MTTAQQLPVQHDMLPLQDRQVQLQLQPLKCPELVQHPLSPASRFTTQACTVT